jgi:phosphotransacetylase
MVACGDADGAVTGNTRRFGASLEKIKQVVDPRPGEIMFGLNLVVHKGKTIFVVIQVFMNIQVQNNCRNCNISCKSCKIIWF